MERDIENYELKNINNAEVTDGRRLTVRLHVDEVR